MADDEKAGKTGKKSRVRRLLAVMGTALVGVFVGRKVVAGRRGGGRPDGGGLAGVREPRRPLPTTPSDSGAGDPRAAEHTAVAGAPF